MTDSTRDYDAIDRWRDRWRADEDREQAQALAQWANAAHRVPLWVSLSRFAVVLFVVVAIVGAVVWGMP